MIYSKRETKRFPSVSDILDKLVCLSIMFGSSKDVEKAQEEDIKEDIIKSKLMHDHPVTLSDKAEKIKQSLLNKKPEEKIDRREQYFIALIMDAIKNSSKKIIKRNHVNIILVFINSGLIMVIGLNVGHVVKENGIHLGVSMEDIKVSY